MVQDHDPVRVEDGVDAVRDGDDGAILEDAASKRTLDMCVRLDVHRSLYPIVSLAVETDPGCDVRLLHRAQGYYLASIGRVQER